VALADAHLERVYAAPLRDFVRARDALAAELRARGEATASRAVKALRRPSAPLWAVNQLARRDRVGLERLLRTVDRVRAAQLGQSGADELPRLTAEYRESLAAAVRAAARVLGDAGARPGPQALDRIRTTLAGAAADEELRVPLRHGRLTAEVGPRGFAVFGAAPPSAPARARRAAPAPARAAPPVDTPPAGDVAAARRRAERSRLEADLAREREAAAELGREQATAAEQAEARRRAAADAERAAREASERAARLAAEQARAERRVREIEARLRRLPGEAPASR
jgi:hypothetical protein